ncbi:putative defensin-like protein 265 [Mercurialis annua]|uniref:putative defensin-like protein 265 n=1 Tax=Mercurialis annua TaxID=3986 RepID=UPI00215F5ECE|nr:putative defensin-like protein 265 [Mercurialis annua]
MAKSYLKIAFLVFFMASYCMLLSNATEDVASKVSAKEVPEWVSPCRNDNDCKDPMCPPDCTIHQCIRGTCWCKDCHPPPPPSA